MWTELVRFFKKILGPPKRSSRRRSHKASRLQPKSKKKKSLKQIPHKKLSNPALNKKTPKNGKLNLRKPVQIPIGEMTHFFSKIQVGVVKVSKQGFKAGDSILIAGPSGEFSQKVKSLQIESRDVTTAPKGALVGLKLDCPAKVGSKVYKILNKR